MKRTTTLLVLLVSIVFWNNTNAQSIEKLNKIAKRGILLQKLNSNFRSDAAVALDSVEYFQVSDGEEFFDSKDVFTYDKDGNNLLYSEFSLMEDETIAETSHEEYQYGEDGRIAVAYSMEYDEEQGELINDLKMEFYFNDKNLIDSIALYFFDPEFEKFEYAGEFIFNYNEKDQPTTTIAQFDLGGGKMVMSKIEREYNEDSNLGFVSEFEADFSTGELRLALTTELSYTESKQVSQTVNTTWDDDENEYKSKTDFIYNGTNELIEYIDLNLIDGEWVKFSKSILTFNAGGNDIYWPVMFYLNMGSENYMFEILDNISVIETQFWNDGSWGDINYKEAYHYSGLVGTNDNEMASLELSIFPNPANEKITVSFKEKQLQYSISDISGKVVQKGVVFNGQSIDISTLETGIYLITAINANNTKGMQKIIKE
jgi:hypothetical protein